MKFFQLIHYGNVWTSVWRICKWMADLKVLSIYFENNVFVSQSLVSDHWLNFLDDGDYFLGQLYYYMRNFCNLIG